MSASYESVDGLLVTLDDDGVLRLVLDRPEKRNALTDTMVEGLITAVEQAGRDEAVRVICLTGAADNFCGGFDIVSRNTDAAGAGAGGAAAAGAAGAAAAAARGRRPRVGSIQRRLPSQAHRLIPLLVSVQTPIVCRVQGWAAGIGLHLVLAADFAVVTETAHLWEPFIRRGFTPDSGATWLLPRRIGEVRAREMLLLGRAVDGKEALAWGMVHQAVAPEDLDGAVSALVAQLAAGPTVSLGLTKWLLHAGAAGSLEEHLTNEAFAMELSSRSDDFREGLSAFAEKRDPGFSGR